MARPFTTTIEAPAALYPVPGGPTRAQLTADGSPWRIADDLVETYVKLCGEFDRVFKALADFRSNDSMYRFSERVRSESRRRTGLDPYEDDRGRRVDYREYDRYLPRHRDVTSTEVYYAHLQIEEAARIKVDQAAAGALAQQRHNIQHTCVGCGRVHPGTRQRRLDPAAASPQRQLCPSCEAGARQLLADRALAGTHTDGRPVRDVLAGMLDGLT